MSATRSSKATVTGPDPSWKDLYRVGSISAFLATLLYIVATAVDFTVPAAPTSGGAATFEYIAEHRSVYILEQVLWLAPSVLLVVVFLALYVALKDLLFDTRFWLPRFMTGSAAKVMAGKLREKGILLIVPPESFFVKGKDL